MSVWSPDVASSHRVTSGLSHGARTLFVGLLRTNRPNEGMGTTTPSEVKYQAQQVCEIPLQEMRRTKRCKMQDSLSFVLALTVAGVRWSLSC